MEKGLLLIVILLGIVASGCVSSDKTLRFDSPIYKNINKNILQVVPYDK